MANNQPITGVIRKADLNQADERRIRRITRWIAAGCIIWPSASAMLGVAFGSCVIDLTPVLVLLFLAPASKGSLRSWVVVIVFLLGYAAVSFSFLGAFIIAPHRLSPASLASLSGGPRVLLAAVFLMVCVFSTSGAHAARRARQAARRIQWRSVGCCGQCGYDLRGSSPERCPECGSSRCGLE